MRDLEGPLATIRSAWMAGRSALDLAPSDWSEALGDGAGREAALVALVAHATAIGFSRAPSEPLVLKPPLPRLALPLLPDPHRPRFRRIMTIDKGAFLPLLLALLRNRGVVAHPADWLPTAKDDWAPDVYTPWLAWAADERTAAPEEPLSVDTWDEWSTADRRAALFELRRVDPDAARALLEAKAASEPAERRARLLEALEARLSEADAPYLEQLAAQDRSERVKSFARRLLGRLGRGEENESAAQELAAMVELQRTGLLHRRSRLVLKHFKAGAQRMLCIELLHFVGLSSLARALGVQELELVEAAPVGPDESIAAFARCVAETGSAAARAALLRALLADEDANMARVAPLGASLSLPEIDAALPAVVRRDDSATFDNALTFAASVALGRVSAKDIEGSPAFASMLAQMRAAANPAADAAAGDRWLTERALLHLGLLASADAARAILIHCFQAGLSPADPGLDLLHLNAALSMEPSP